MNCATGSNGDGKSIDRQLIGRIESSQIYIFPLDRYSIRMGKCEMQLRADCSRNFRKAETTVTSMLFLVNFRHTIPYIARYSYIILSFTEK